MNDKRLRWIMSHRPGAVESVLERSFGGSKTPYHWLARSVSSSAKKVLVVHCGSGGMVEHLKQEGRFIVGLDWSESSIDEARRRGRGVLVQADANYLPFHSETFDAVVSDFGLGVNENRQLLLLEAARVLRSGGMFAALAPSLRPMNIDDARRVARLARQLRVTPHLPGDTEFRAVPLLAMAGLQKVEDSRARFYFDVRNREDAELLIGGLRPTDDVDRARQAVNYLAERVKEHTVRLPLPMRRLLAIK